MARFFFHLRDCSGELIDEEGTELPSLAAAREKALEAARDILSHEMKAGRLNLSCRIDIADEQGRVVGSLPLRDAFETFGEDGESRRSTRER